MKSVWGFRCGVDIETENGGKGKISIFLHHKRFFRFFPLVMFRCFLYPVKSDI